MSDKLQWFRMYSEFATDPKVQMLSEVDQRRLVMLFCLRCCNGNETFHDDELTFQLRISSEEWQRTKSLFVTRGFIDGNNKVLNWSKRQYESDSSTARVRRHRNKMKRFSNDEETLQGTEGNAGVTSPDTETDTEKERAKSESGGCARTPARETGEPPDGVDLARWATFVAQLEHDGKVSAPRIMVSLGQLRAIIAKGTVDPNLVLDAAIQRGFRDLAGMAATLEAESQRSTWNASSRAPIGKQAALEAHNRAVGERWAAQKSSEAITHAT